MPIRRAAATPTQEKAPSAAAEKEPKASEESPPADEEPAASSAAAAEVEKGEGESESKAAAEAEAGEAEPTENGEEKADDDAVEEEEKEEGKGSEKKELKDGYKYEKAKVKKVKRTIPAWASVTSSKKLPVSNFAGTQNKVDDILIEAITSCTDKSGVSYKSVMKFIEKKYPDRKKFLIKKAIKKHLQIGTIKQLKGKGLSGTFAIGKRTALTKKIVPKQEPLGDALPLIITRLCEPKEASYYVIKKYLEQHFPAFNIEKRPDVLKTALVKAVERGQLQQITGTGARGTFQLKRTGNQALPKGSTLEDAIIAAITAMNEPKTCSTTTLRKYLVDANKDRKAHQLVANLRRTLTKCKVLGWMEQITGHGFTGTYQLSFPYYPSPAILYPGKFHQETPKKNAATPAKRRRVADSSDEEEESSEEEEEDEPPPAKRKSQKRPPPKVRHPQPAKKSRSSSQSKAKGRARPLVKKSPAKKGAKTLVKKGPTTPSKASPVKRGAPARKPKTPAIKKLSARGTKRPAHRESAPEEPDVSKQTARGSKRSKVEESTPEKPVAKKAATKGRSRSSEPKESSGEGPVAKKGAKSNKKAARKSKRGRN